MMPPDPVLLGVIMFLVGVAWYIAIGVRKAKGHALEAVAIVALVVGGLGMVLATVFSTLMRGH